MQALQAALRCNSPLKRISGNCYNFIQLSQIPIGRQMSTCVLYRERSRLQLKRETPPSNIFLERIQTFSTKFDKDIDVKDLERVYYGSLTPRMKAVKIFSLTTSIAGLAAQPLLMEQGIKIGGTGMAVFFCSIAGFFTFVTPFLLHFITKKYVTEMHYNPVTEEYVATTFNFFLQKVLTKFRTSDVKVPEVPGMFTSFHVGKIPLFLDPVLFEDPEHYVRIMGYDKPIDFKLDLKETTCPDTHESNKPKK